MDRIAALARRVGDDEFFLASALADYARSEGLDDQELAAVLDCSERVLSSLRLCRRPRHDPVPFGRDLDQIASRFDVNTDALAEMVRRSDALNALRRQSAESGAGTLMAARDREGEDTGGELP